MNFKFTNMKTNNKNNKKDEVNKITPQQQEFVNKVASGDSATTAYVNVYNCKKDSASSAASRLLKKPSIKGELSRLKKEAEKNTLMDIQHKRALLTEMIMSPAVGIDPKSPLVQNVKIKRRTLPDGTIEEDITVTLPDKLKAIELDAKLSGQFFGHVSKAWLKSEGMFTI